MMLSKKKGVNPQYLTWYAFRQDLAKTLGHTPLNEQWLKIKPKAPLPWDGYHMRAVVSRLKHSDKRVKV